MNHFRHFEDVTQVWKILARSLRIIVISRILHLKIQSDAVYVNSFYMWTMAWTDWVKRKSQLILHPEAYSYSLLSENSEIDDAVPENM